MRQIKVPSARIKKPAATPVTGEGGASVVDEKYTDKLDDELAETD
jgi:hypothetical protein